MSWGKAVIEIKPASTGTGVKASLKKVKSAAAKLSITITGSAVKAIGWAAGDGIEVLIGEAEHHGLLRMRKNKSVGQVAVSEREAPRGGLTYQTVALGHQACFVDRSEVSRWCQWEQVEEGWIEIVLPKWADETAPRKSANGAPKPATIVKTDGPLRKENVTSTLMGDPPAGRREMLEKVGKIGGGK